MWCRLRLQVVRSKTLQSCAKPWVTSLVAHEKEQNSRTLCSQKLLVLCFTYVPRSYRLGRLQDLYAVVTLKVTNIASRSKCIECTQRKQDVITFVPFAKNERKTYPWSKIGRSKTEHKQEGDTSLLWLHVYLPFSAINWRAASYLLVLRLLPFLVFPSLCFLRLQAVPLATGRNTNCCAQRGLQ